MAGVMSIVRCGEVDRFLRRKFRLSCGTGRIRRRIRKRIRKVKRVSQESIKRVRWFGRYNTAGQIFAYIIGIYSCSANRYVMFRSNRRFKPGD